MNLFYEKIPRHVVVNDEKIGIVTDFREVVKFIDILKSEELNLEEKIVLTMQYFKQRPKDLSGALMSYWDFVKMKNVFSEEAEEERKEEERVMKVLFSFESDYPYIYSAFLRDYNIDIQRIRYMHWWRFQMLFDGLDDNNEIKKRMMYRSIDTSKIKDKTERRRIEHIQRSIALVENQISDFDIGNALM